MFAIVEAILISFVEILKVFIPLVLVMDMVGDMLWKQ